MSIAFPGGALASGNLDTPLGGVMLENGHEEDCVESVTELCLASGDLHSVGDSEFSATQDNVRIGAYGDDSVVTELTGIELLPDGAIFIDVSQLVLPNPAFQILTAEDHWYGTPDGEYGVTWNSTRLVLWIWGPSVSEPFSGLGHREQTVGYGSKLKDEGITGLNDIRAPITTDGYTAEAAEFGCNRLPEGDDTECRDLARLTANVATSATPNIEIGLGIDEVGLQYDPDFAGDGIGERESVGSIGPRSPVSFVLSPLDRSAPEASPLDHQPTIQASRDPDRPLLPPRQGGLQPSVSPPTVGEGGPGVDLVIAIAAGAALAVLLAALYARITRGSDAAGSPQRAAIILHLRAHGPASIQALASALGVHRTTILHHALVLQRLGEIKVLKRGMYAILALPEQHAASPPEPRGALRVVLDVLRRAEGNMTRQDIHNQLAALPLRTRNHALHQLTARGFVAEQGDRLVLIAPSG